MSDDCPYSMERSGSGRKRIAWFTGYFDGEIIRNVGHILKRHGVDYP